MPDPGEWEVERLRLTVFPIYSHSIEELEDAWQDLFDGPPDRESTDRLQGSWEATGLVSLPDQFKPQAILHARKDRVDWLVVAPPSITEEELVPGAHLPAALPAFQALMARWLKGPDRSFIRIAFGGVLQQRVTDLVAGGQVLSNYLPFEVPPSGDFTYKVNRPVQSSVLGDGTVINRLSTWALQQVEMVSVAVQQGGTASVGQEPLPFVTCRLEFDVNTDKERAEELPSEELGDLLAELARLATEIATTGDMS